MEPHAYGIGRNESASLFELPFALAAASADGLPKGVGLADATGLNGHLVLAASAASGNCNHVGSLPNRTPEFRLLLRQYHHDKENLYRRANLSAV